LGLSIGADERRGMRRGERELIQLSDNPAFVFRRLEKTRTEHFS
jgi:hypothetical protein